jgi:hypothetical protein
MSALLTKRHRFDVGRRRTSSFRSEYNGKIFYPEIFGQHNVTVRGFRTIRQPMPESLQDRQMAEAHNHGSNAFLGIQVGVIDERAPIFMTSAVD